MLRSSGAIEGAISGRATARRVVRSLLEHAERWYVVFIFLTTSGAVLPFLYGTGIVSRDLDLDRVVRFSMLFFVGGYIVRQSDRFLLAAKAQKLSLCLPLLAIASAAWSVVPAESLPTGLHFATITAFGLYLAARFRRDELIRLVGWALGVAAVTSLMILIMVPAYGFSPEQVGARGAYAHKNTLGMYMVLSTVTFALIGKGALRYRWIHGSSRLSRFSCWCFPIRARG